MANAVAVVGGLLLAPVLNAGVVTYTAGEQDFAAGAGPILVAQARVAGANEAFPFNGTVFGDDRMRSFGKIRFGYAFAAPIQPTSVTLSLGLIGLDSPPGSRPTVKLFLDGVQQPSDLFAGVSTPDVRASASVISVPVPLDMLADGVLNVMVKSFRAGPGYPGNAIEADFSTLTVVDLTPPGNGTPGGGGNVPGDGGSPDPDGNGNLPGEPGDGEPGDGEPGGGKPGNGSGNPGGGGIPGGGDGGTGGGNTPPAVPLPPAVLLGGVGLIMAAALRKRGVKR